MTPMILFVEDEVLIADMMEHALTDAGFGFEHAASAEEAIKLLEAGHDRFAAVVTDIGLPGKLSGWDVARYARELNPELPIVYATGGHGDGWPVQGVPKSILVGKPYAGGQIVTAVSTLLNTSAPPV